MRTSSLILLFGGIAGCAPEQESDVRYEVRDIDCEAERGLDPTGAVVFYQALARFEDASGQASWSVESVELETEVVEGSNGEGYEQFIPECMFDGQVGWRLVFARTPQSGAK